MGNLTKIGTKATDTTSTPKSFSAGGGTLTKIVPSTGTPVTTTPTANKNYQSSVQMPVSTSTFSGERIVGGGGRKSNQFSLGKLLGGAAVKGVDEFISGLTSTAAWLENATLGTLFPGTTDNSPIQALNDRVQQAKKANQEYTAANVKAGGKAAEIVDKYGTATAAAIPQAGLAILTGGGSTAAQGTSAGLQAASSAAQAGTGFLSTVKSALSSLYKDPQYWLSFASTAGNSYEQAKADGTSDAKASLYALGNGLMSAAVEVGGGIQKLPGELQNGTKAFKAWLDTMLDEGKEEVVQGVLERGLQNLVYQKGNPLFSTEDESAILNPKASASEFAGGVVVGGLLGGGQSLFNGLLPGVKTSENTENRPTTPTNGVLPTTAPAEQKTAPNADNDAKAASEESTVINTDPTQHTAVEQRVIDEYQGAVDDNLVNFVETSIANKGSNKGRYTLKPVSDKAALDIKNLTGVNANGFKTVIEQRIAEHIVNRHGANGAANKSMADINDVARMQYVIDNYDRMEYGGKSTAYTTIKDNGKPGQADTVKYIKAVNGTYYVVEAVPDTKAKTTYIVSAYMDNKNEASNQHPVLADGPTSTPESAGAAKLASSDPTLTQPEPVVKSEGTESVGAAPSGYGPNTVGSAQAQFKYQEAPTQSVADNLLTEREMKENPELQNTHQVLTNAEGRAIAGQMLANEYGSEVERLKTDEWGAVEQVEGYQILSDLVDKARETGDYSEAVEWKKLFDRKGTEAGQALQARAQFTAKPEYIVTEAAETLDGDNVRRMSDEKKRTILDNVEKQANTYDSIQEGDTSSLIALIERNNEIRRTTGLFSKKTSKQMDWALNEVVKNYPETAEQFLRDVAVSQIRSISSDYQKLSPLEAVKNYRIMGMLSKASTVMRNLVSNNVFDPLESLSNNVGIIADGIMSIATGQHTTAVDKSWFSKAKRSGSLEGALKSYIQVGLDADVGESSSRYETGDNRTFKMTGNFLERLLSTWTKYENYALKTTDEFQKGGIAAETQRGIEQLQQSGKLAEGMLPGWAEETAKQRTFQNEGAIAEAMVGLRSAANKLSIKDKQGGSIGVGDVMLPFARVPGNLVAQAANYSPLGIANGLREITNVMVEAKKGNYSAEAQAQAARNFGRGVTGTGLLAGFAALAAKGLIDVAGADDKDKEALEKAQGRTGTQWNLSATMRAFNGESTEWQDGDTLMSIGFLDPINSIMAAAALISDAYAEDNNLTIGEIANASFSSLVQSILDLPAMSSISSLIDAYTYAEGETAGEKAANAALDYAGSQASSFLLPNALKGVATGLDDTVRNQYSGETVGESTLDSIKSGIPGLRSTLPASLDPFGREKTQTGDDVLNILNNNLLPGAITKYSETKVEGALEDLYDQTGVSGIYPNKSAPTSVTIDKNKVQLDADQQATYQRTAGQTAEEIMSDMMDTKTFRNASDSEKAEYLELANKYARAVAAGEATNGKYEADKYVELAQTAKKELGLTEAEYLMLYQDYGGSIMNGDKLREAYNAGIKVQDYLDYYTTASKYDADKNNSYTIVERGTSILQSGLSGENQQALWSMYYPEWKDKATDVDVSYETYIDYKYITNKAGASKKADKIAALQAAGYSYNEAVNLYTKIK